jgi:hypothetical protein
LHIQQSLSGRFCGSQHVKNGQKHNWPFVDIGWLEHNATHAWEKRIKGNEAKYAGHIYPLDVLYPTVDRPFGSLTLSAPRDGDRMLQMLRGKNWRQKCVKGNWDHKLEKAKDRKRHGDDTIRLPCSTLPWVPMVRRSSFVGTGWAQEVSYVGGCKLHDANLNKDISMTSTATNS